MPKQFTFAEIMHFNESIISLVFYSYRGLIVVFFLHRMIYNEAILFVTANQLSAFDLIIAKGYRDTMFVSFLLHCNL